MNDLVLDGFVSSFAGVRGFSNIPEQEVFEAFVTSSILRKYHQTDITGMEDDVLVGGSRDGGLDAVAVLVNGRLVNTDEDVAFFFDSHRRLDVELVFIQAKTSQRFQAADIGNFAFGVEQYFNAVNNQETSIIFTPEILQKIEFTRNIYGQSIKMHDNPKCFLYYATTGKWTDAPEPRGRIEDAKKRLEDFNLFSDVRVVPVDADLLKSTYRELERSIVKEVEFIRAAAFPRIDRVGEAYIGLLPGNEFIRLVSTDDGELNRELFFDNVRDFQGYNPVNREIGQTLSDDQLRNSFPLLNNGITIIARSLKRTGDIFQIHDFQIVNGCQTTHILFQNRHVVGPDTFIPVKLVSTDDGQVVNEVIKATNRQTVVLPEALESLSFFHRELEDLYSGRETAQPSSERIYYERRSKQYALVNIPFKNIVSLTTQIKSFIAMFLDEPHSHPRYYGELLKAYEGRIFASDHRPEPYYAAGVASIIAERWLNSRPDWRDIRSYRYQLLMLVRMSIGGYEVPRMNSMDVSKYALGIVEALRDPDRCNKEFSDAVDLLRHSLEQFRQKHIGRGRDFGGNLPYRLRAFTEELKEAVPQPAFALKSSTLLGTQERGKIRFFDDFKRYGFIGNDRGVDMFVHETEINAVPYHLRVRDVEVLYTIKENPKSPGMLMAADVRLVPLQELAKGKNRMI